MRAPALALCGVTFYTYGMNTPQRLVIEIVFDFVCPWCYLGIKRLLRLCARRPDLAVTFSWRPFLLNPDMPRTGMSRTDYLLRKFGGEERARRLHASITALGAAEGIEFNFEAIRRTANSIEAHRLTAEAARQGCADALVLRILEAHFQDGLDIGNEDVLVTLAVQAGMEAASTRQFLAQNEGVEQVRMENLAAHRRGVNGVPCFILDGETAISGAQESEVLERLIELTQSLATPY